ncbi:MAG: bifunctional DNA-formamidopyrimidine glycosylase/DNA-(apurinic or apyrimidinic site) lyase [Abditibacteriales bacterium]|nr:bifunctional DNA-formamidopyrimidine glycosylase/DNA-(apurinic or apyrimidinic site) lyase [Abditibacteriales bacterium]MDW8366199.1 bifunctional DNA-formamidopyrimidine glycosylase/DNA-(apurinic or apyrimidinic site) lyase [Abditibacteriales bacterium]
MPELPEVETIRRDLEKALVGATIVKVWVSPRWARLAHVEFPGHRAFRRRVVGRRIERLERRGKYLIFCLDSGYLIFHLGMSGQLLINPPSVKHRHALLTFADGRALCFVDPRTFGELRAVSDLSEVPGLRQMGPEPFDATLTWRQLADVLRKKRVKVKAALLDQRVMAGMGNIYADEALFESGVHPERRCTTLTDDEVRRLLRAVRHVLRHAIASRGTTLPDSRYRDAFGQAGGHRPKVYGRAGEPCVRCGATIRRGVMSGRSFHYCPQCQG